LHQSVLDLAQWKELSSSFHENRHINLI